MKKILIKSFSLFMALIMMFTAMPLLVSAVDVEAPVFSVKTVSETTTELQLAISLTKGSFVCFDCTLTVNGLKCQSIVTTDAYDAFAKELVKSGSGAGVQCGNIENGKFSLSTTGSCPAPMDIVVYTFAKESAAGINGTDVSFTIDSCYVDVDGVQTDYTASTSTDITLPDTHTHTSGEWTTVTEPKCNAKGLEVRYCTACGATVESRDIDMTEHENTHHDIKAATCTEDGYDDTYCDDCKERINHEVLTATHHKNTTETKVEAKCEEDGYIDIYCNDCKKTISHTTLPKTGHNSSGREEVTPTCTNDGYIKIYCTNCTETQSYTPLRHTGHSWTSWSTVKEPTYRSVGYERRYCTNPECGEFEDREIPMIAVPVTDVKISMEALTMNYKQSATLYADVMPEEAAFSSKIVWTSSNPKVVSVDENGVITATGKGHATVTASTEDEKFSASCEVTVQYSWIQIIIIYVLFGWIWYMN